VDRVDEDAEVIGIDRLVNTVTEIEYVSRVVAETGDDLAGFGADFFGAGVEYAGIEIAL